MDKSTAENAVKGFAVLFWLVSLWWIVLGVAAIFFTNIFSVLLTDAPFGSQFMKWVGGALVFVFLLQAVFFFFVALGLWKRREWARMAAILLCAFSILEFPFGTLIGIVGLWLFAFNDSVKELFSKKG